MPSFLGYFDEGSGKQYFSSIGEATRPWDATDATTTLLAHWMVDLTDPDAPEVEPTSPDVPSPGEPDANPPVPPTTVDPTDLFPGRVPSEVVATDGSDTITMATTVGEKPCALAGTYDGVYAETATGDAAIVMNAYTPSDVPDAYATRELSIRAMVAAFEATSAAKGQHLQGFRILSTGSYVSVTDLYYGEPVTLTAKTSDIVRETGSAAVAFNENTVTPVFGPTSAIPPLGGDSKDWPYDSDPGDPDAPGIPTQVLNVFDARVGSFGYGTEDAKRFESVSTGYDETLRLPTTPPSYDTLGYSFDGWFTESGTRVSDDKGALVGTWVQKATGPTTYYARYVQKTVTITFKGADGTNVAGISDNPLVVYKGIPTEDVSWPELDAAATPGHRSLGWYTDISYDSYGNAASHGTPYCVADDDAPSAEDIPEKVDADIVLLPYLVSADYALVFRYDAMDKLADYVPEAQSLELSYGQKLDALPTPEFAPYEFLGWYPSASDAKAAGNAGATFTNDNVCGGDPFVYRDGAYFFEPTSDNDRDEIELWAAWNVKKGAEGYTLTFDANGKGYFPASPGGDQSVWEYLYSFDLDDPDYSIALNSVSDPDLRIEPTVHGWEIAGWHEMVGDESVSRPADYEISFASGKDRTFTVEWKPADAGEEGHGAFEVSFVTGSELKDADALAEWAYADEQGELTSAGSFTHDFGVDSGDVSLPVPTNGFGERLSETVGYVFKGWRPVAIEKDEDGKTVYVPIEDTAIPELGADGSVAAQTLVDALYADADGGEPAREIVYQAVWDEKPFDIRFHVKDADGAWTDMEPEDAASYDDVPYDTKVALPAAVFRGTSSVFSRWDNESGAGKGASKLQPATEWSVHEVNDMFKTVHVEEGANLLDLYAITNDAVNVTVPLKVNIAFDPMNFGDSLETTYLDEVTSITSNSSKDAVFVETVAFERLYGDDDATNAFMTGGGDMSDRIELLLGAGAKIGSTSDYLAFALGAPSKVYTGDALAKAGFANITKGSPLKLDFTLRADDLPAGTDPFYLLAQKKDTKDPLADGIDVARVFYTVSLAR